MDSDASNEGSIVFRRKNVTLKRRRELILSSDSEAEELKGKENNSTVNTWSRVNLDPHIYTFVDKDCGIKAGNINDSFNILDYFKIFFSDNLMTDIVNATNNYYRYTVAHSDISPSLQNWSDATINELYTFLALTLIMSRMKKLSIKEYWSTNEVLRTDIFNKHMSRDRYLVLLKMLCFGDKESESSEDRLTKIRQPFDKLRETFQKSFCPFRNLCIDESLFLFKGRLFFKQYIPSKRNRFEIKLFVLCDCSTGFVLDVIVYTGLTSEVQTFSEKLGKTGNIVATLMQPYLGKGHQLFVDNWYSSPALFQYLHSFATNACGTVKKQCKGMPKMSEKLEKGDLSFRSSGNLLALKWQDKREVWMLSTSHSAEYKDCEKKNYQTGENIQKPSCIIDYSKSMNIVDRSDAIINTVSSIRKTLKWYKKFFFHLLDISIWNAYCLYKFNTKRTISMSEFHLTLITKLLNQYSESRQYNPCTSSENLMRFKERHFPAPYNSNKTKRENPLRRCIVCSKNNKRCSTRYYCKQCNVGLCVAPCFEIYHTKE
ncbi:piggyBac transposable element-derived protein 4 [Orussus abietinus]|uniref:piggyBac transposable element-derived protein 4 n=1 Tax=Orussus abietinus TaxID=222816 RepID=UPI0006259577|nr:piggyBac transposable element-derived protein 4 [Orussus abietinus]